MVTNGKRVLKVKLNALILTNDKITKNRNGFMGNNNTNLMLLWKYLFLYYYFILNPKERNF